MGSRDRPPSFEDSQAEAALLQDRLAANWSSAPDLSRNSSRGNDGAPGPSIWRPDAAAAGPGRGRNWDDPPEHNPVGQPEPDQETTMILVEKAQVKPPEQRLGADIQHVAFSPSGAYVAAQAPHPHADCSVVHAWSTTTLQPVHFPREHEPTVQGRFALSPAAPDESMACDGWLWEGVGVGGRPGLRRPYLQRFVLEGPPANGRRAMHTGLPVASPLAWSPDGALVAGASAHDTSRIYVVRVRTQLLVAALPHHIDAVTHLAFTPDGTALVSLSRDGSCQITGVASGRVLRKYEVETRHNPRVMAVSRDGDTVAAVWGRDVVVWAPASGAMSTYNLSAVRHSEGAALAVSSGCEYLACRSEGGFDVLDLRTGKFRAEVRMDRSFVTTAAFSEDGRQLVVGKHNGEVMIYTVVVADPP